MAGINMTSKQVALCLPHCYGRLH